MVKSNKITEKQHGSFYVFLTDIFRVRKSNAMPNFGFLMWRNIFFTTVSVTFLFSSFAANAAYLSFTTNWDAPSTKPMSKRAATNVVMQCKTVSTYSNMAGAKSGAVVVAGPHETIADKNTHLTVRLYKDNTHAKSCHVYVDKSLNYSSCSCEYID